MNDRSYDELTTRLTGLHRALETSIIGQPKAINAIMGSIERYQAGLHDGRRPLGVYLFVGPTGSGKTYSVETLARELFDKPEESMLRIDCSEYSLDQDIAKIFGASPGYIGSDNISVFTKAYNNVPTRENGFILLIDEIEKASKKFFDTWLQVFEGGKLTDGKGNVLDFSRSLVFLTSNVGAEFHGKQDDVGFRTATDRMTVTRTEAQVDEALRRTFRPEFLNRLSGTVHFAALVKEQQQAIVDNMIAELNSRLAKHYIHIDVGSELKHHILEAGFSKEYGARHLRRTITNLVEMPLARLIINGTIRHDSLIELNMGSPLSVRRIGDYPILMEDVALL